MQTFLAFYDGFTQGHLLNAIAASLRRLLISFAFSIGIGTILGYLFAFQRVVVISGDTIPVENMVNHSQGVDLLVHESYNKAWLDALIAKFPEQTIGLSNPAKYSGRITRARDLMAFDLS